MPPSRKANLMTRIVAPFGPHHCASASASVHAFHTRIRGASNTREMVNSSVRLSPVTCALLAGTVLLLVPRPADQRIALLWLVLKAAALPAAFTTTLCALADWVSVTRAVMPTM